MFKIFVVLISLFASTPAFGERSLPDSAKKGELTSAQYPYVTIGGKRYHLAPGARVYDRENRIILPASYPSRAPIAYQQDLNGDVVKIWLLTAEEQKNFKKKQ